LDVRKSRSPPGGKRPPSTQFLEDRAPAAEKNPPRNDAVRSDLSGVNRNLLNARFVLGLLKDTFNDWMEDGALRLSAALAYYSIFSLAPLLVIVLGVAGWASFMMGPGQVNEIIYGELGKVLGPQSLETIRSMVESASKPSSSKWAAVIGGITLLIGAGGVFGQLKDALNTIWEVKTKPGLGIKIFLRERLLSFGMVLVIGFLLLISLVLTTGVTAFGKWVSGDLPLQWLWTTVLFVVSFGVITALFAFIFKVLPDATVGWQHVWIGAVVTALLFELGKFGLGLYLGRESTASSYGAAAAVVLVLLWVYYGSCILFFGAEFTQVYAKAMGHEIRPSRYAEPVTNEMRAQEGLAPRKEQVPPAPEIVVVPVAAPPPPSVPLPRSLGEVPAYVQDNPVGSLLGALGFGLTLGFISRALEREPERSPAAEVAHGSKALALAGAALAAGSARHLWKEAVQRLRSQGVRVR
jgi:membrane protein